MFKSLPSRKAAISVFIGCVAIAVLYGALWKAGHASMTHDESSTYLNLVQDNNMGLWSCYRNPACWTTANNHLLNTLGMRWSTHLFSATAFSLRLPNLLLLVTYLICVILFLRDTSHTIIEALFGIAIFVCNPYVLDFFALARGYGMGLGLMMASLFFIWKYLKSSQARHCVLAFIFAVLSVFANLIYLAFVVALAGAIVLVVVVPMLRKPGKKISGTVPLAVAGSLIFLAAYFYRPILILIGLGEFDYGAGSLWQSWEGFIRDSLYEKKWLGDSTVRVCALAGAVLFSLASISVWIPIKKAKQPELQFARCLSLICLILFGFLICNHFITGANYPSGRKSIVYFPLIALMTFLMLHRFARFKAWPAQIVMTLAGIFFFMHLVSTYNGHTYREWWYDSDTKAMTEYVAGKAISGQKTSLAVEWIYHPSSDFYVSTQRLPIRLMPYSKEISKDFDTEYYYVEPHYLPELEPAYTVDQNFNGSLLLKKVANPDGEQINEPE